MKEFIKFFKCQRDGFPNSDPKTEEGAAWHFPQDKSTSISGCKNKSIKEHLIEFIKYLRDGFPVNRPLREEERAQHLPQGKPSPIPVAWPQLSVVRMNSTYLECVDVNFLRKGLSPVFCLPLLLGAVYFVLLITSLVIEKWNFLTGSKFAAMLSVCIFMILGSVSVIAICIWILRLECFDYTHRPMRFNRKTRMVHAFPQTWKKGEIISVPWDELFFSNEHAFKQGNPSAHFIYAHKLAEDGETVLATFMLSQYSEVDSEYRFLQWEFVRQYMEGDDKKVAELANMVDEVMGVGGRRETPYESFRQAWACLGSFIIYMPLIVLVTIGRQIVMWTCKIPRWPDEIEATCQYSPDDPNLRDGKHLAPRGAAPFPDVTPYAGR